MIYSIWQRNILAKMDEKFVKTDTDSATVTKTIDIHIVCGYMSQVLHLN